ncbi:MAG: MurR/RpiR family transcriptional regulator [Erysipelotrichaceae bacterium]|nr:MurR/RpiR family transcriptional regulator [Erysipelotrichaceae bacterium]
MEESKSMYWLNIVLFSILDSESEDSNDYIIAKYLLQNYNQLSGVTLSDISEYCNVSKAAVSRFCKKIGLLDYVDLQMLIRERRQKKKKNREILTVDKQKESYNEMLNRAYGNMQEVMDNPLVEQLINDLQIYDNIYLFGHLQASHIAFTFRTNLAILSKFCYCTQTWSDQKEKIYNATDKDLFIVFSSTGDYFKRIDINMNRLEQSGAKVYIVTFEKGMEYLRSFVNKIFLGKEPEDPYSNVLMNMFVNYVSYRLSASVSLDETK